MRRWLLGGLIAGIAMPVWADPPVDALQWLNRVTAAAKSVSYTGTFIYQSGAKTEISRITHLAEAGHELERLEVLDGSPREVLRDNDVVKCFLPESRLLIVERRKGHHGQTFPALLPASLTGLTEHYTIRKGSTARVAGLESQAILIEPKDDLRYGHQFWIDSGSGLLLKAGLINERGETLETFAFTDLRVGGPVDRNALKPHVDTEGGDWTVRDVRTSESRGDNSPWQFRAQLPGFRKVMGMKRQGQPDMPEMTHVVFSDGLAAISVFIEPLNGRTPETGAFAMGAVNVFKRVAGDYVFVVMGDVPPTSLKKLAEGIEVKSK